MIKDDDRSDLPTLREEARDLPVLLPGSKPRHERAAATAYPAWSSLASQRHVHSDDLWLCNARGIFHRQGDGWTLAIAQTGILTLASWGHRLWLGTIGGLMLMDLATTKVSRVDIWPAGEVAALAPAPDGVWVACGGQVGLATLTSWTPFGRGQRLPIRVTALASSNENEVWIGTHDGLLYGTQTDMRLHLTDMPPDVIGRSSTDPQMPPAALSNLIQALAVQHKEQGPVVWIGTPAGLFCLDSSTENWKRYSQHGLHDIRALATSPDGSTLLSASWSSGLYCVKEQVTLELSANLCGPLLTLAVGPDFTCWAAGPHGLYQRKGGSSWICVLPEHKLPSSGWIRTMSQSSPTRVWIGTTDGLFSYHPMTEVLLPMSGTPLANADIRCLLSLMHGQSEYLWVGTSAGLYSGPPSELQKLPDLAGRAISAQLWDSHNHMVWVGTDKGLFSLIKRAANEWVIAKELTSNNSGLAADHVTALAFSSGEYGKRQLWIGTPCGLSRYSY